MCPGSIRQTAKSYMNGVASSHDWHHVVRVLKIGKKIADAENADRETVTLSALLHDIGRRKEEQGKIEDHASWGAIEAKGILQNHNYELDLIESVRHSINAHRYSMGPSPETLEAEVLSDADNLDAMGAIGIARTFCFSGENNRPIATRSTDYDGEVAEKSKSGLSHIHEKLLKLKERMLTDTGKDLAKERHAFMEEFSSQILKEIS